MAVSEFLLWWMQIGLYVVILGHNDDKRFYDFMHIVHITESWD